MFQVWLRTHTATKAGFPTELYDVISVHDASSKTTRITANAYITDANSMMKSNSQSVISRLGFHGATLKLIALLNEGRSIIVNPQDFNMLAQFSDRDQAQQFRDNFIDNYTGTNTILGRSGFKFKSLNSTGKGENNTFGQPISGNTQLAVTKIDTLVNNFAMSINSALLQSATFTNGNTMRSLHYIILYCSSRNKKHDPLNTCTINGVTFEEGEFKNYGQVFKKLLSAHIIQ